LLVVVLGLGLLVVEWLGVGRLVGPCGVFYCGGEVCSGEFSRADALWEGVTSLGLAHVLSPGAVKRLKVL